MRAEHICERNTLYALYASTHTSAKMPPSKSTQLIQQEGRITLAVQAL
jgi:hypothetical protein